MQKPRSNPRLFAVATIWLDRDVAIARAALEIVAFPSLFCGRSTISRISPRAPRLLSVTESSVLPPTRGGQYVKYIQVQCSRMAGAPGAATGRTCTAGRRCVARSMVVRLDEPAPSAQVDISLDPIQRTRSSLTGELDIRATDALDKARNLPAGEQRAEAMQEATILENAAQMLRLFGGKHAGKITR
jgi:hypothetical protein